MLLSDPSNTELRQPGRVKLCAGFWSLGWVSDGSPLPGGSGALALPGAVVPCPWRCPRLWLGPGQPELGWM